MKLSDKTIVLAAIGGFIVILVFLTLLGSTHDVQQWSEVRLDSISKLQNTEGDLSNTELNHARYMVTGAPEDLQGFTTSAARVDEDLAKLTSDGELIDKVSSLQLKIKAGLDEMRLSANVRKTQGEDKARALMSTSREVRDTFDINRLLLDLVYKESSLLRLKLFFYAAVIDFVRWLSVAGAIIYVVAYLYIGRSFQPVLRGAEEKNKQLSDELQSIKAHLDRLANIDVITEVLNVRGLEHVLAVEENRTTRAGGSLIAVLANIDNFKKVNETQGHATGDAALKEVAKRIAGTLRPSDHVARVTGDEFLILLIDTQLAYAMRVAERIRMALAESPIRTAHDALPITASVGVAALPPKISSLEEVLQLTRSAMKRSKAAGKNRVSLAREGPVEEEQPAERDIVEILCDGTHFRTVFQPIVDLNTEQVNGYEVYTRGPDGAFESPAQFFRVCIENNILTTVDILCLKLAISAVTNTKSNLRYHINVFPSTLLDTSIENLISLFPADRPGKFCVEISEQQFVGDPGYLRDHVNALRQAGILVAIDDVGFGRSSLESLILLEPDIVKVDRKYVTGVAREPAKARLLKRVVNVAKSLGAEIVAEGIEVKDDLPVLREIGIHYGQGYYWGDLLEVLPSSTGARAAF